ncbi:MAG: hypothetical protein U0984_15075 [Prosthecobacter sp.]|nr:hypothetical protein [Prosthecobacter sp.]
MKTKLYLTLAVATLAALQPALLPGQNISPAAGSTISPNQVMPDGFIMIAGRTYTVRNGVALPLDHEMILRVTPTGVIGFDQLPRTITSNAMLTMDGRIVAAPERLVFPPVVQQVVTIDTRLQDRGVYGANLSGLSPARNLASAGPHPVIAKKKSTSAKRSTSKDRTDSTPAFSDAALLLPNYKFAETATVSPVIDVNSTMLSATTVPATPLTPESNSISSSLGVSVNPTAELKKPTLPEPPTPLPATVPTPSVTPPTSKPTH